MFGINVNNESGLLSLSDQMTKPKTKVFSAYCPLQAADISSNWTTFVEINTGANDRFVGFELLDGQIFYGLVPGGSVNSIRMLTNMGTTAAVIGESAIPAGYGIEIYGTDGARVFSDTTAAWPLIFKVDGSTANYNFSVRVNPGDRVFVFGVSCALISISGGRATYAGVMRSGEYVHFLRGTYIVYTPSFLGSGIINFGEKNMSGRLFNIMNF